MMKIAVIGSRDFKNEELLNLVLDNLSDYILDCSAIALLVSGGAAGADLLAEQYAQRNKIQTKIFLPDYDRFGRSAPLKRNVQIVEYSEAVVAFWNGASAGTLHAIKEALKLDKKVIVVRPDGSIVKGDFLFPKR
jgi:hypothetical protein